MSSNSTLPLIESGASPATVRRLWPSVMQNLRTERKVRVSLVSTFTVDPVEPYLGWELARFGIGVDLRIAPYSQVYQQLLDQHSAASSADVTVVLVRIEELFVAAWTALPDRAEAVRIAEEELERFRGAVEQFLIRFGGLLLVSNFGTPQNLPLGLMDASNANGGVAFAEWLNTRWREVLSTFASVRIFDLAGAIAREGMRRGIDRTRWFLGKVPYSEAAMQDIGRVVARFVRARVLPPKKVLVLDCDGTLWGGVLGEDGLAGIAIGEAPPGNAYADFQQYVMSLRARGILLALASKNNELEVWDALDNHSGMVLRKQHISAARVNWRRKSENLREIAIELNLGLDSFVFADDSPLECSEVGTNCPEVAVIRLPEDPALYGQTLEESGYFDRLSITEEDRARADQYAVERRREDSRQAFNSLDDYLRDLALVAKVSEAAEADVIRVAQLTNKTNQFNLTTQRLTEEDVRAFLNSPDARVYTLRVSDRFGDYGLTGVAIVEFANETASLHTFLLSCRVLGRKVEHAFLQCIEASVLDAGIRCMRARFIPTQKNTPARGFLDECGFTPAVSAGAWQQLDLTSAALEPVSHVTFA